MQSMRPSRPSIVLTQINVRSQEQPPEPTHQEDRTQPYTWEIELSNGIEIEFDKDFRVIDIDD